MSLLFSSFLLAQSTAGLGGLNGVVNDATGSVIPNVKVTVSNEAKGIRRALESNAAGIFNVPSLVPAGGYTVRVEAAGFTAYDLKNITIQVG